MSATPNRFQDGLTMSDAFALLNRNFDAIDDQDRTKIISNAGVPQVLFGYQSGGFGTNDYGLKISKMNGNTPYDVRTATNDQLIFSSAFNNFKIVATGTYTVSTGVISDNTLHVYGGSILTHGLGFTPAALVFSGTNGNQGPTGFNSPQASILSGSTYIQFPNFVDGWSSTSTDISYYLGIVNKSGASYTWSVKYYLLQETAI